MARPVQLNKLFISGGQFIEVEGLEIPVKEGSWATLVEQKGELFVNKFYIAEDFRIKEYTKKGPVETLAKSGRKLTLKDGKIVNVSRF